MERGERLVVTDRSELVLTEVPRAIRRAVAHDPQLPLDALMEQAAELLDTLALLPLDQTILLAAGALQESTLRALDAIHVTAALELSPVDAFVSYDERQSAAARLAGLRTMAPTAPEPTSDADPAEDEAPESGDPA